MSNTCRSVESIMCKSSLVIVFLQSLYFFANGSNYNNASTIQVTKNGSDDPVCLLGSGSCFSLGYVLNSSMWHVHRPFPLTVVVTVSQNIEDIFKHRNILNLNSNTLLLKGVGYPRPSLQFTTDTIWNADHNFVNFTKISFQGFNISGSVKLSNGKFITFYNCRYDVSVRSWFYNAHRIHFLSCSFYNSRQYGDRPGLQFVQIKNANFSDCIFGPILPTNDMSFAGSHLLSFTSFRKNYTKNILFMRAEHAICFSRCKFQDVQIPIIGAISADEIYSWSVFLFIDNCLFYNNTNNYTKSFFFFFFYFLFFIFFFYLKRKMPHRQIAGLPWGSFTYKQLYTMQYYTRQVKTNIQYKTKQKMKV